MGGGVVAQSRFRNYVVKFTNQGAAMRNAVSASEANRSFSRILREVEGGATITVTSHGRPVARIVPVDAEEPTSEARDRLMARLRSQPITVIGPWTRDELYDD